MAITRRTRNDANSSANIINVLPGIERSIHREGVLQGVSEYLTPGCIVVPATGTPPTSSGYQGAVTRYMPPTGAIVGNAWSVLDITPADGGNLLSEYKESDQVPAVARVTGATFNVRISANATVEEGQALSAATDGSGFVVPGGAAPIGVAREDLVVKDPDLPTFILMEVL